VTCLRSFCVSALTGATLSDPEGLADGDPLADAEALAEADALVDGDPLALADGLASVSPLLSAVVFMTWRNRNRAGATNLRSSS
jgi:hypothetical protein